jgi:hypothetical protein
MTDLVFDCVGARNERYAVVPTLTFALRISETGGRRVDAIALRCQIRIQPQQRRYDADEAARLLDLFGEPARWAQSLKPIQLTTVAAMVPGFTGSLQIDLPVPCTYDLEVGWARYINALGSGTVPLLLLFSGTVFSTVDGRMSVEQVPWSKEAEFALPVAVWRDLVDTHFPNTSWIRVSRPTLDALLEFKSRNALPTWDSTIETLLAGAREPMP